MFLFGLEGSGFIIAVALTLLVSGAIMFYCLKRFSVLESAVTDQGKILQSFIQNNELQNGGLASNIAVESAIQQSNKNESEIVDETTKSLNMENSLLHHEKIEVSDDDSSDDDSSDDDSSDDDDDDDDKVDDNRDVNDNKLVIEESIEVLDNDKKIELVENELIEKLNVEDLVISKLVEANVNDIIDSQVLINSQELESVQIEEIEPAQNDNSQNLEKLKVGELRSLAIEKNLVENTTAASKLKKEELLKLLIN